MHVAKSKLIQVLEGANKEFSVPAYQRNYDWKEDNCEALYDDTKRILEIKKTDYEYFIGSIVRINEGVGDNYLIIDGQQRIITVTLMILSVVNLLKKGQLNSGNSNLPELLTNNYLINQYADDEKKRVRLKSSKNDQKAYLSLMEGNETHFINNSQVTKNYQFFVKKISEDYKSNDVNDLYEAIKKLVVVDITLDSRVDKPQEVFESINSTGAKLATADLVRNFVLMGKNKTDQDKLYNNYWSKIEDNTFFEKIGGGYSLASDFLRDYLTYKKGLPVEEKNVYREFKLLFDPMGDIDSLLEELLYLSKVYKSLKNPEDTKYFPQFNNVFKSFSKIDNTTAYPFIFDIFIRNNAKILPDNDVIDLIKLIESYIVRRAICGIPTNALKGFFGEFVKKYLKDLLKDNTVSYFDVVKAVFRHLQREYTSGHFPSDGEVRGSLEKKFFYTMKLKNYILERLENFGHEQEPLQVVGNPKIQIEHIMPQKLSPEWKEKLKAVYGDEYEELHAVHSNTIGNLTLLSGEKNSKLSNASFLQKKQMEGGFNDSHLRLTKDVSRENEWLFEQIQERTKRLADEIVIVWSLPATTYTLPSKES